MMKKIFVIVFLLVSSMSHAAFLNISTQNGDSFNAVIVEKDKKRLHVVKVSGDGVSVLKSVNVLTGKGSGDKQVQGDSKTPEGVYRVMGFLSNGRLKDMYGDTAKLYGYGAYPLSYPNTLDRLLGKTGGGIWLHGVEDNRPDPATKGCVAFDNHDVKIVGSYLSKGTPVVITSKGLEGSKEQYHRMFSKAKGAVTDYLYAWQNNDFDKFRAAYSKNFRSKDGRGLNSYLSYKKSLMEMFPNRKVAADRFRVFYETENEAVVEFDQYYSADNITAFGRKTLFLRNEGGQFRILAEDFEQTKGWDVKPDMEIARAEIVQPEMADKKKPEKTVKPEKKQEKVVEKPKDVEKPKETEKPKEKDKVTDKPVEVVIEDNLADINAMVTNFLDGWKQAWESKDIEAYIALYADDFKSGGMDRDAWKKDKEAKFAKLDVVAVVLSDVGISALSADRFEAVFRQGYTGDSYSDIGTKTLRLQLKDGNLKIVSEQWRVK